MLTQLLPEIHRTEKQYNTQVYCDLPDVKPPPVVLDPTDAKNNQNNMLQEIFQTDDTEASILSQNVLAHLRLGPHCNVENIINHYHTCF